MASKAKSGLSAVRQFPEKVLEPPNTFVGGAASFMSSIRDGKGHSEYHVAAANLTAFTLKILHAWRTTGPFTLDQTLAAIVDPETGLFVAEIIAPISKRYIRIVVDAPGPGLDAATFEVGGYFLPRPSGAIISSAAGPAGVTPVKGSPGATITSPADVVVGVGATVALPASPPASRRGTVQNTGITGGSIVRARQAGGLAGSGLKLPNFSTRTFGGADGALGALEVEEVSGVATTVAIQYEAD